MNSGPHSTCARRFADITDALCRAVMNAIRPGFIQATVAMLVYRRIKRVQPILLGLEARLLAGEPLSRVRREPGVVALAGGERRGVVVRDVLPRRLGWLCPLVPSDAACFAGQLRVVLAEPGMMALLERCPQAVRIVRPLCRMLGIERADFVPGERVATSVAQVVRAEPVEDPMVEMPSLGEAMMGLAWVRFIPG